MVTRAGGLATRFVLAGISATGVGVAAGSISPPSASAAPAPTPLTLTETWSPTAAHPGVVLDDAPCGVAEASPVEFHDGGTAAVEVGDREGDLYGLNLADGSVASGWGSGTGSTVGSGQG